MNQETVNLSDLQAASAKKEVRSISRAAAIIEFFGPNGNGQKVDLKELKAFKDSDPTSYTALGDAAIKELGCVLKD